MSTPYRFCLQCGKILAAGQTQCDACGARIGPVAYDASKQTPQPWTDYGAGSKTPSAGYDPYAPPPPPPALRPLQPPLISQPPQPPPKRPASRLIIVGVLIVSVLLLGGGAFAFISAINNSGKTSVPPTPTPRPSPSPTPTPQLLFSDNFADNHNNWDVGSGKGWSASISNNALNMKETDPNAILSFRFPQNPPADAMITLSFTIINGDVNDGVGLRLRSSPNRDSTLADYGYYVEVKGDGKSCLIGKLHPDPADNAKSKWDLLLQIAVANLNPPGSQNQMTVIAKGSSITLLVNNKLVQTVSDASSSPFMSGSTYFVADHGKTSKAVEVNYHSVAVYPAPATPPAQ